MAKIIAYSCPHGILVDKDWEAWLVKRIRQEKPDEVICLGDLHEAMHASRWPSAYNWTMTAERDDVARHMDRITRAAPDVPKTLLMGNHDANMLNVLRIDADKFGHDTFDWTLWYDRQLNQDGWNIGCEYVYDPEWGAVQRGQVTFTHGYSAGTQADKEMALVIGQPYGLTVSGHTHRPKPVTQVMASTRISLPYWFANPGCGRTLKPDYAQQKLTQDWGQGLVVVEYEEWRYPNYMPREPRWEAWTEIFRGARGYRPDFHHRLKGRIVCPS